MARKAVYASLAVLAAVALALSMPAALAQGNTTAEGSTAPNVTYAVQLIQAAGLTNITNSTIFAPDNDAFNALPFEVANVTDLLNSTFLANSTQILNLHVVPGVYTNASIPTGNTTVNTTAGIPITLIRDQEGVYITVPGSDVEASVIAADIPFGSNIVHVIDNVLLPFDTDGDSPSPPPSPGATTNTINPDTGLGGGGVRGVNPGSAPGTPPAAGNTDRP